MVGMSTWVGAEEGMLAKVRRRLAGGRVSCQLWRASNAVCGPGCRRAGESGSTEHRVGDGARREEAEQPPLGLRRRPSPARPPVARSPAPAMTRPRRRASLEVGPRFVPPPAPRQQGPHNATRLHEEGALGLASALGSSIQSHLRHLRGRRPPGDEREPSRAGSRPSRFGEGGRSDAAPSSESTPAISLPLLRPLSLQTTVAKPTADRHRARHVDDAQNRPQAVRDPVRGQASRAASGLVSRTPSEPASHRSGPEPTALPSAIAELTLARFLLPLPASPPSPTGSTSSPATTMRWMSSTASPSSSRPCASFSPLLQPSSCSFDQRRCSAQVGSADRLRFPSLAPLRLSPLVLNGTALAALPLDSQPVCCTRAPRRPPLSAC